MKMLKTKNNSHVGQETSEWNELIIMELTEKKKVI